jgi:hypothetical protein
MSEYQYYEWQIVDRVLTRAQQTAVGQLSSHIEVGPASAVITYNWGNFKHDPNEVLLQYFDAHFYQANWGSVHLAFRFPKGLLPEADLQPYLGGEWISFETDGEYQILSFASDPEDYEDFEPGWSLSDFIGLRADILQGDYRALYLFWLHEMAPCADSEEELDENGQPFDLEPPVPPGLKDLSPALHNFMNIFNIDPFLVRAAAEASEDLRPQLEIDYRGLIANLSRAECEDFLARLAQNDPGAGIALRNRLIAFLPPGQQPLQTTGQRSLGALVRRAAQLEEAERQRQAEEARQKHITAMQDLAARESKVWQEINRLLETGGKTASVYDQATGLLAQLYDLAEYQGTLATFRTRLRPLAEKYSSRPSLMDRWRKKGWL